MIRVVSTTAFVHRYKDHKFTKIADKKAIEMINDMSRLMGYMENLK